MKAAIVGSSGYIAEFLLKGFKTSEKVESVLKIDQIKGEGVSLLDLRESEKFDYSLLDNVDFVVFTAAISAPDQCAEDFEASWKINVTGTRKFITEALKRRCKVLFFSSDAVFGDIPGVIYQEESETCANTHYGKMKKVIEDEFKSECNFKSLRLSYVISAKDKFISYCMQCIKAEKTAEIYHPFYRNCIAVNDVVKTVLWFSEHWLEYQPFSFNLAGKELVSRIRIADELNRIFPNKLDYTITEPSASFYRNRPKITQMVSIYNNTYEIVEDENFTKKIQREIRSIIK